MKSTYTEEDYIKDYNDTLDYIRSQPYFKDESFYKEYCDALSMARKYVAAAKIYILDNYKKIDDWTGLYTTIRLTKEKTITFYDKELDKDDTLDKVYKNCYRIREKLRKIREKYVTAESLTDVVYDWTDGDFSVTINGVDYMWIEDEPIMDIAQYIRIKLSK